MKCELAKLARPKVLGAPRARGGAHALMRASSSVINGSADSRRRPSRGDDSSTSSPLAVSMISQGVFWPRGAGRCEAASPHHKIQQQES